MPHNHQDDSVPVRPAGTPLGANHERPEESALQTGQGRQARQARLLMLHTSTGKPTKAQEARFRAIKDLGCVCCRVLGFPGEPPEIHHLLSGNVRRGHDHTVGLCPWHHRGVPKDGWDRASLKDLIGPPLSGGAKAFRAAFGSDDDLLLIQDALLTAHESATSLVAEFAA